MIVLAVNKEIFQALVDLVGDEIVKQAVQDARDWIETQELERIATLASPR